MQATRERIVKILKERQHATVEELSDELGLTPVTVRHHLGILKGEGLIAEPTVRRRKSAGRPQYVYSLARKASALFPKRYADLACELLDGARSFMQPEQVDELLEQIGTKFAGQACIEEQCDFESRLAAVIEFLNEQGFMARWEKTADGSYLLHVANCLYEDVARRDHAVCAIGCAMLSKLVGFIPELVTRADRSDDHCVYKIHPADA